MKLKLWDIITSKGATVYWRERPLACRIAPFLPKKANILDIGAGSGKLGMLLGDKYGQNVTLIDVVDHNVTPLPLELYNGLKLPQKENSYDVALLVFVLHHAADATKLVLSANRVTKKRLIIIEDTPANKVEHWFWQKWDYFLNHAQHEDIAEAHTALNPAEWQKVFEAEGFTVTAQKSFRTFFPVLASYRHTMFVLDKQT